MIIFFHSVAFPVAIMIPQMMIMTNQAIRITAINILIRLHINTGNTDELSIPLELCAVVSIQSPIKGTLVLSFTPQQTLGLSQGRHGPSPSICPYPWIQLQVIPPISFVACRSHDREEVLTVQPVEEEVFEEEEVLEDVGLRQP